MTATFSSTCEDIPAIDPVPLYLVPQMVTAAVHRCGEALAELHVRRGGMHFYTITVVTRGEEA
ncbi:hypothetical protein RJ40_05575 [Methanofollis aquaemaris]|uniref:Uncharacterized protein n=2 Tax=Methanofollis aquaemaris TaxID=126734 RepID=A0A8A3SAP1_9EURY|nr:hypothetical protein RJ40_05575 [Methanofollis aquaemaris]